MVDEFFEDGLGAMIETNRGCPFHFSFCVWGAQYANKVTQFSIDRVKFEETISNINYKNYVNLTMA
jgi:hypothetical protein